MCGSDDSGEKYAKEQEAKQAAREAKIRQGTSQVNDTFDSTFNDGYYSNLKGQYTDLAEPDIQRAATNKHSSMLFNLARQGLAGGKRGSNTADRNFGELDAARGRQMIAMERNADNVVNKRRNAIESARANVLGQLNVSADVGGALQSAQSQADMSGAAPHYNPIGDVFSGVGGGLIQYNNLENLREVKKNVNKIESDFGSY